VYKNSDGSDEQGVMIEVYGSDVVFFPIIAEHIVIVSLLALILIYY